MAFLLTSYKVAWFYKLRDTYPLTRWVRFSGACNRFYHIISTSSPADDQFKWFHIIDTTCSLWRSPGTHFFYCIVYPLAKSISMYTQVTRVYFNNENLDNLTFSTNLMLQKSDQRIPKNALQGMSQKKKKKRFSRLQCKRVFVRRNICFRSSSLKAATIFGNTTRNI